MGIIEQKILQTIKEFIESDPELIKAIDTQNFDYVLNKMASFYPICTYQRYFWRLLLEADLNPIQHTKIIPTGAYLHLDNIRAISIPASVQLIMPGAFASCKNLKDVYFPKTLPKYEFNGVDTRIFMSSPVEHFYYDGTRKELAKELDKQGYLQESTLENSLIKSMGLPSYYNIHFKEN